MTASVWDDDDDAREDPHTCKFVVRNSMMEGERRTERLSALTLISSLVRARCGLRVICRGREH